MANEPGQAISCLDLLPSLTAPGQARRHARAELEAWTISPDTIEITELIVSELMTNAVVAGDRPGEPGSPGLDRICLKLRSLPGRVVIEVSDQNPRPPILSDADGEAEDGRGLMLVQALSEEWGHYYPPGGGKTVFSVLSIRDPSAAPARQSGLLAEV